MQGIVTGCCCPPSEPCCYSSLACVVDGGIISVRNYSQGQFLPQWKLLQSVPPTFFNAPVNPCFTPGCRTTATPTGTPAGTPGGSIDMTYDLATTQPFTYLFAPPTWSLYSQVWQYNANWCGLLTSGPHAGEYNRDPRWFLRLIFQGNIDGTGVGFTLTAFYRRLSQTLPDFRCPSLGVYEYESHTSTNFFTTTIPIASMSSASFVTLI